MGRYTVNGRYSAVVDLGGQRRTVLLAPGDAVELDDDVAEFIGRDAPGVIEPEKPKRPRGRPRGSASNRDND